MRLKKCNAKPWLPSLSRNYSHASPDAFKKVSYICIAWVHIKSEACICKTDNSTLLLQTNTDLQIAKNMRIWWTSEIGTTSEERTKGPFPKCPLFGGSTVVYKQVVIKSQYPQGLGEEEVGEVGGSLRHHVQSHSSLLEEHLEPHQ